LSTTVNRMDNAMLAAHPVKRIFIDAHIEGGGWLSSADAVPSGLPSRRAQHELEQRSMVPSVRRSSGLRMALIALPRVQNLQILTTDAVEGSPYGPSTIAGSTDALALGPAAGFPNHPQPDAKRRRSGEPAVRCPSPLMIFHAMAREGIEPPTRGFSVRCSTN
jgi:hypothetical protein